MFSISNISENDKWIFIKNTDGNSATEYDPFVKLVKNIAKKWNNDIWEGNITPVGNMRYKIKKRPS